MLETLGYYHFLNFLFKRLHWKNKFDSCPCPPEFSEDPKLRFFRKVGSQLLRSSTVTVWMMKPSVMRFLGWTLLLPKTLMIIAAPRIPSAEVSYSKKKHRVRVTAPLCMIYFPVFFFSSLVGILWRIMVLKRKGVLLKTGRGLTNMGDD